MKITTSSFRSAKGQRRLTMLTAYDYTTARVLDQSGVDSLLVGDSLGMVMLGHSSTLPVTMEDMIRCCASVARGVSNALLVCDLPFMAAQNGIHDTVRNAGRLVKEGGAEAVKLEGGRSFCGEIAALVRASIPVMGHIGLTPQSFNAFGGFRVQGKSAAAAQALVDDALAIEEAGVFAMVLECVPAPLGAAISKAVEVPVIGIGAGPDCDGQVLVWQDMAGLNDQTPKFVRRFAELGDELARASRAFQEAVSRGAYPGAAESYGMPDAEQIISTLETGRHGRGCCGTD